jgi:hypothetical protein
MAASIAAFNCVYIYCFHNEMYFLPLGTQVQYKRVRLLQYLISHRPSLLYRQDTPKIFLRNFGIYQPTGCHTHKGAAFFFDYRHKFRTSIVNLECNFYFISVILNSLLRNFHQFYRVHKISTQEIRAFKTTMKTNAAYFQLHICVS